MGHLVDLFGWDTVFAISYEQANVAIQAANTTPTAFKETDDNGICIDGTWSNWQITTGGDGQNLQMHCPVVSGQISEPSLGSADLSEGWVQIQVKLNWIPDPSSSFTDPTGKGGTPHKLVARTCGTENDPAVIVVNSDFPKVSGTWKYAVDGLFHAWFNGHLAEFDQVFSVLLLNVQADKGDYQWLKPSATSYACADSSDGSPAHSVFGVLCMTDNTPIGTLAHQIDARLLADLPADANSVFAISGERTLDNIFRPGAVACIQGSRPEDFQITNDNLWVVNKRDVTWGNFELQDGQKVQPRIGAGNFQMGLQDQSCVLKITDATFDWPGWQGPGSMTVHMSLQQNFEFELKQATQGWVFVPKQGSGTKSVTATVTTTEAVDIFEICTGIAASIIGAVLGAVIGSAISAASTVATESATEAVINVTEDAIIEAEGQATEESLLAAEEESSEVASEAITNADNPGYWQRFACSIAANKWKIVGSILGTVLGAQVGLIAKYVQLIAKGDLTQIPPFDQFAGNCVGATQWPYTKDWQLRSAGLSGPLLIAGKLVHRDSR